MWWYNNLLYYLENGDQRHRLKLPDLAFRRDTRFDYVVSCDRFCGRCIALFGKRENQAFNWSCSRPMHGTRHIRFSFLALNSWVISPPFVSLYRVSLCSIHFPVLPHLCFSPHFRDTNVHPRSHSIILAWLLLNLARQWAEIMAQKIRSN